MRRSSAPGFGGISACRAMRRQVRSGRSGVQAAPAIADGAVRSRADDRQHEPQQDAAALPSPGRERSSAAIAGRAGSTVRPALLGRPLPGHPDRVPAPPARPALSSSLVRRRRGLEGAEPGRRPQPSTARDDADRQGCTSPRCSGSPPERPSDGLIWPEGEGLTPLAMPRNGAGKLFSAGSAKQRRLCIAKQNSRPAPSSAALRP